MTAPPPREDDFAAIRTALSLMSAPPRRRQLRKAPLPSGVDLVLKVAADPLAAKALSKTLQRSPRELSEAASFFIEQVLLSPESDAYRTLGASLDDPSPQLRQNFVHLCKWLHAGGHESLASSAYLVRITQAWNNLKTPERRTAYNHSLKEDLSRRAHDAAPGNGRADGAERWKTRRGEATFTNERRFYMRPRKRPGFIRRLIAFAFGSRP